MGATHVLVVCDTLEHSDFPVYVHADQDVARVAADPKREENMEKIMQCYDLSLSLEAQIEEHRAWHGWSPSQ